MRGTYYEIPFLGRQTGALFLLLETPFFMQLFLVY